jgi:transposase
MQGVTECYIGIDVSQKELEVSVQNASIRFTETNDPEGINKLVARIKQISPRLIVIEATGGIEMNVAKSLFIAGLPVAVVNPRRTHAFARAIGKLAKTDEIDAIILAKFAEAVQPDISRFRTAEEEELMALVRRRKSLVEMRAKEKNRLKCANKSLNKNIRHHIAWLSQAINDLEEKIQNRIKQTPLFSQKDKIVQSFNGAGPTLSQVLLAEVPELGYLNRKEIAALVGVAPMNNDSGSNQGNRSIQGGRAAPRSCLYMAAVTAIHYNSIIQKFYERLRENGKSFKVAIIACMRKIIVILNAMIRDMKLWNPNYS